jgi:hypothetical protein
MFTTIRRPASHGRSISRASTRTWKRRASIAGAVLAVPAIALAISVPAEAASSVNGRVMAQLGLNVHSGSPTGQAIDTMPYNSTAQIYCWVSGPSETGPYGSTSVWDALDGYTTPSGQSVVFGAGAKAFSSDAWLDTGGDTSTMASWPTAPE